MTMDYNAVMVDLETLSTENNAVILSIGAVRFWLNVKQEEFSNEQMFYMTININSCINKGLNVDGNTVNWWMNQSIEAKQDTFSEGASLDKALYFFSQFVPNNAYIFGNGATFDNIILRSAYKACSIKYPVSYKYDVCYRTLSRLSDVPFPRFDGTKHNALDDAKNQTIHLMQILDKNPWSVTKAL